MQSKSNVCAVIVTYNRKELLSNCLQGIFNQSFPVDNILIIDNASTDGTFESLMNKGYLDSVDEGNLSGFFSCSKNIQNDTYDQELFYVRMPENTGGAGGFYEGMKRACELSDYIWLMDDDGVPQKDCLYELMLHRYKEAIYNPLVINSLDKESLAFQLGGAKTRVEAEQKSKNGLIEGVINPFNGTFFHRGIVEKIGLPKKEMFIWGDEEEYTLRAKKFGIKVFTVLNAIHFHPKEKSIKKKVLFGLLGVANIKPNMMQRIYFRNQIYNALKYKKYNSFFVFFVKYLFFSLQILDFSLLKNFILSFKDAYELHKNS